MHLWPSSRIRDSFKLSYLKNLEWNLHRMKSEESQSSNKKKLLDDTSEDRGKADAEKSNSKRLETSDVCNELFMILSCCYCCFCCGESDLCKESPQKMGVTSTALTNFDP